MCIFAIGNRQAALHCIVFGQVFPANPMNQEFHTVWLLLHLLLNLDFCFILLLRFNLWSLLNFTLKQNRALESSNRKWRFLHLKSLMTWMMHGEGGGSRLRNFSWCSFWILTWLIVPLIHPHPHGPMMIRVLCKNIELINQTRCGVFQPFLEVLRVDVWHIQKEDATGLLRWEMGWQVT